MSAHPRAGAADIARGAEILRSGGLVAFPTETVYGLGADASNSAAIRRLYAVKGRPPGHPVIVHVASSSALQSVTVEVSPAARALADSLWPGPLTLVLRRRPGAVVDEVTGGGDTVGIRVPDHPVARALLDAAGVGVAAPSANRFGRVSPTTAADVSADLGDDVDLVLDGGPCRVGVESTIVDCTVDPPRILRHGGVAADRIASVVGALGADSVSGRVAAPGTLASHYAPHASVELVTAAHLADRAAALAGTGAAVGVLALAEALPEVMLDAELLAAPRDVEDYARILYSALRRADAEGLDVVVAVPPPDEGVGTAVADRLRRAAAPRPAG